MNACINAIKEYIQNLRVRIVVLMCMGVALIGISIGMLRVSGFGADPFSCMNLGISSHLPVSYGTFQLMLNTVLLVPVICLYRKGIGLGTIVNMVCVAYIADFTVWLMQCVDLTTETAAPVLWLRILLLLSGFCVLCLGVALYMECGLGVAPYDAMGPIIEECSKGKIKFRWARVITDLFCFIVGCVSGAVVGVATVVTAFFTGPLVGFFREKLVKKWTA